MDIRSYSAAFGLASVLVRTAFAGPVVPVEWVESAGSQYVDIGLKGESGLKAEIDMSWTDPSGDKVFMGCSIGTANDYVGNIWFLGAHNANLNRGLYNGYMQSVYYAKVFPAANERTVYTSILDAGLQQVSTNGVALLTKNVADAFDTAVGYGSIAGVEGGWNLYVFANHSHRSGGSTSVYGAYAKCYGIKVWKKAAGNTTPGDYTGATLVRDLKPAVKDGNAGLWDEVTQQFYPGQGSYAQSPSYLKYPKGKTYEWTGAAGGGKWSTPANWQVDGVVATVPPYSLCSLVFGASAAGESENDIEDLWVEKMSFSHASKVTLRGKAITFVGSGCVMPCAKGFASIEIHNKLVLTQDGQEFGNDNVPGSGTTVGFYGDIDAAGLSLGMSFENSNGWNQTVDFYGKVTAAELSLCKLGGSQCFYHFHSSGNPIDVLTTNWGYGPCYDAENALTADTVLTFNHAKPENHNHCQSHYLNANQVANCIDSDPLPPKYYNIDHIQCYDNNKAHTLTLRGSRDATTSCVLQHKVSLVWDPVGDYVQTFLDRVHTTTGSLTVKGGTLRSGGTNSFSNVSELVIAAGATFDAASTNEGLFASCKDVSIGNGGQLKLGGGVTNAFPADVAMTLSSGARIVAADDTPAFSLGNVVIDGLPLVAGDYTGEGGTSGKVIPQIVGKVKITVAGTSGTYWSGATSDKFNVAGNWTAGVPAADNPAVISKFGTYTVKLDDPATPETGDLQLMASAEDAGVKTLEVSTTATVGGTLTFGRGGKIAVTEGGDLTVTNPPVWKGGGVIEVAGTLKTYNYLHKGSYVKGADVKISGNGQWLQCSTNAWPAISLDSAAGVTNVFEIADNGYFDYNARITYASELRLNYDNQNGVMGLKLSGNGRAKLGRTFYVARGNGAKAFVEMSDKSYLVNRYYSATFGASGDDPANPAVGELYMKGGCFDHNVVNNETNNYNGLTLGYSSASGGICSIGRLYLEDGVVTNRNNGIVYLGLGAARGEVHQTGGRFIACQVAQRHYEQVVEECERPIVIGMNGGEGLWEMSGGYAECSRYLFVGGCTPEYMGKDPRKFPAKAPGHGTLAISGGEFRVAKDVVVSYAGEGTVEIGAGGLLTATDMELCDPEGEGFDTLGATLRFRPVGATSGKVALSGALKLGARSTVEVDAAEWSRPEGGFVTLLEAGEPLPAFGDRLVVKNLPPNGKVVVRGNRLRLGIPRGMSVIIR